MNQGKKTSQIISYKQLCQQQFKIIQSQDQQLEEKTEQISGLRNKLFEMESKLIDTQGILLNLSTNLCTQISTELDEIVSDQNSRDKRFKSFISLAKPIKKNRQFITFLKKWIA